MVKMKTLFRNSKGLILGLIIGMILATAGTAFAGNNSVTGVYGSFKYLINGQDKPIQSEAVIVNGKSYLPIRDIGSALGYDIEYDDNSRTIGLSNNGKKYLTKGNDVKVQSSNNNVSSQGFVYEKLPLTKTIQGVTVTINSITVMEDKTAFDITVKNDNTFAIKIDAKKIMRIDNDVEGRTSEIVNYYNGKVNTVGGIIDFGKEGVNAGEEKNGIAYMAKISNEVERINFFPSSSEAIADFEFYIDTKGLL
jgi:hypothetical protein